MALPEERRVLAVEKIDRFTRNQEDAVTLKNLNATLVFIKQGLIINKDAKSSDLLNFDINLAFAKFYVANLSEEVKKGLNQKAKEGHYPSVAPLGYLNKRQDTGRSIIEPDPINGPKVKKIFELHSTGQYSLEKLLPVTRSIGLQGNRLKKTLTKEGIRRLLSNPIYYGVFKWNGVNYVGRHQPLISKALFDKSQMVLRNGSRPRPAINFFPFRGLLRCKHCGCIITAEKHTKASGRSYVHYHCTHTRHANGKQPERCQTGYWPEEKLISIFAEQMLRPLTFPREILTCCKELLSGTRHEEDKFDQDRLAELHRKLAGLKRYQEIAYEDKIRGIITEEEWISNANRWKSLEFEYLAEIERLSSKKTNYSLQAFRILELSQDIEALYLTLPIDKKAELLGIISSNSELDAVSLYPKYKRPFDLLAKRPFVQEWRAGRGSNPRPSA